MIYRNIIKPFFDILFAGVLFIILFPLLFILSVIGFIIFKENPYFLQLRAGKYGHPFVIYKFKTLKNEEMNGYGKFLRQFGLDELPQLLNILRLEMSFVGPRPLYVSYIEKYTPEQAQRLTVMPGITGCAQIYGRNNLTWSQKFEFDVLYINKISFLFDLKILFKTIFFLFAQKGSSEPVSEF